MKDKTIIKRLFAYLKPHKKTFIIVIILTALTVICAQLPTLLLGFVINELGSSSIDLRMIALIVSGAGLLFIGTTIIQYEQTIMLQKCGQRIILDIREVVFKKIEEFDIEQFNKEPIGKLVTRATSDVNTLNDMFTNVAINFIRQILTLLIIYGIMLWINIKLALIILAICPVIVIATIIFRKFSRNAHRSVRTNVSNMNAFLSENISGVSITQAFNQEEKIYNNFSKNNEDLKRSSLKEIIVFAIFRPFIYVIYISSVILILYYGAQEVMSGVLSFGLLISFYQYISEFFNPIQQLADNFNTLQQGLASSEKIFDILDRENVIVDAPDAIELENIKGEIEFKDVWFKYKEDEWILKGVSFKVMPKETVAFVGATGAGKTTILSLIVRNYEISKGQILIDGIDIKKIKISSLRRFIGQMLQDVFLFSGDINSNIRLRDETIGDDDIIEASKYVNADKFILKLDDKYETKVKEGGNNFSSGERQLLSFARTIVHKPSIMILDEATANIDTETEILIQKSLESMMNISTMLIVAHRLSTIQHADKIIVLQKGVIIESGNHQELLKQKGHYYKLYKLQFNEKENNNEI